MRVRVRVRVRVHVHVHAFVVTGRDTWICQVCTASQTERAQPSTCERSRSASSRRRKPQPMPCVIGKMTASETMFQFI